MRNKTWLEEAAVHFGGLFDVVYAQPYDHWETGGAEIDSDVELEKLSREISADGEDVQHFVFARSIGTILSLAAVTKQHIAPKRCIFFGTPLNLIVGKPELIGGWEALGRFPILTLAFHNRHDPTADYDFLISKLAEVGNTTIEVVATEGDHHEYRTYDAYLLRIREFITEI